MKKKEKLTEETELEQAFYASVTPETPKTSKKKWWIIAVCVASGLLLISLLLGFLYYSGTIGSRRIEKSLYVAGVDIGGMTLTEAIDAVRANAGGAYELKTLRISIGNDTISFSPELTSASLDVEKAVKAAFIKGKLDSVFNISPYLGLDKAAIMEELEVLKETYSAEMQPATYEIVGTRPALTEDALKQPTQTLKIYTGKPNYTLDTTDLYQTILDSYNAFDFEVEYDVPSVLPEQPDLDAIYKETYIEPADAQMDKETFEVTDHSYGYGFDLEKAKKALAESEYDTTLEIKFTRIAPKETKESLSSLLFRDVLGTYTAYSSSSYNRDTNLKLACQAVNGVVVYPGEIFRYNATLGERTPEKGYKPAAGYWGSEVIMSYGGGICQVSSSLYYCTLIADLEIVERHSHGYISAYMPYGMDATVDWAGPDFKFRNTTDYPVKIEAYASGGTVTVNLYGTDTKDYYVKMEYEVLDVYKYDTVYKEMTSDNKDGYKDGDVINSPYTGFNIKTYKCKYSKETDELISRAMEEHSIYSKRDKLICKIVDPKPVTPATKPQETQPQPPAATAPTVPATTTPHVTSQPTQSTEATDPTYSGSGGGISSDE